MQIEGVSNFPKIAWNEMQSAVPTEPAAKTGVSFLDAVKQSVEKLNSAQVELGEEVQKFMGGQGPNVHTLMIDMEKTNLAVEFGVQVRNKVVDAYNEIMHMQM
jgi:flagellar hook-basal body complex protein FliE